MGNEEHKKSGCGGKCPCKPSEDFEKASKGCCKSSGEEKKSSCCSKKNKSGCCGKKPKAP